MKSILFSLAILTLVFFSFCSGDRTPLSQEPGPSSTLRLAESQITQAANRFGFRLLQKLEAQQRDSNIFLSPLSVSLALGMTLNGANGETARAIRSTLGFPELNNEEINRVYRDLVAQLAEADPKIDLRIANSLWYRPGLAVLPDFLQTCRDYYAALVKELDFNQPGAADSLNRWVKESTGGKIEKITDRINPAVVVILLNAIYYKGTWTYQFDPEKTTTAPFYLENGETVTVPMMKLRTEIAHLENELFRAVQLPYGKGRFRMVIFLPASGRTIGEVLQEFIPENWHQWMSRFRSDTLQVEMPRFKLKYQQKLNRPLAELGMGLAFTPGADFSRLVQGGGIWIDEVRHKTFLEVNEEGSEAGAVTMVTFVRSAGGTRVFRVDHPFLLAIYEADTSAILFLGKVMNPLP